MNKKKIAITILLIISIVITIFIIHTIQKSNRRKVQQEIIENWTIEETNIIKEDEIIEEFSDSAIGKLKIPILSLDAEIAEGTDSQILSKYIGHLKNSSIWDGNVVLASHNRGENVVHYFENIHKLQEGDLIVYVTRWGQRKYKVESVIKVKETDWSITESSEENIITLITCIKGKKELRLCVKAVEI